MQPLGDPSHHAGAHQPHLPQTPGQEPVQPVQAEAAGRQPPGRQGLRRAAGHRGRQEGDPEPADEVWGGEQHLAGRRGSDGRSVVGCGSTPFLALQVKLSSLRPLALLWA